MKVVLFLITSVWNFDVTLMDGTTTKMDSLLGEKVTVISFWGTWCAPCKEELTFLNELYSVYKDSGLQVIGVNTDSPRNLKKVKPMVKSYGWKFPIVMDLQGSFMRKFGVRALPTSIFVDCEGKIIERKVGFTKKDKPMIKKLIKEKVTTKEEKK